MKDNSMVRGGHLLAKSFKDKGITFKSFDIFSGLIY